MMMMASSKMISPTNTVLSPLESFNFGIKYLWANDPNARVKVNMIDTIIFKEGKPFYWVFTSEKTGVMTFYRCSKVKDIINVIIDYAFYLNT
jgi:hypothetical protein